MNVKLTKLWVDLNVLFTKLTSAFLLFIYFRFYRLLALLTLDPLLFQIISNYTQKLESTPSNLNSCDTRTLSHKKLNPWLGFSDAEGLSKIKDIKSKMNALRVIKE